MKKILFFATLFLILACQPQVSEVLPEDLAGLKKVLKTKKADLKELTREIADLETRILALDTNVVETSKLVTILKPERKDLRHFVTVQGSVQSDDIVNASSEIGGRIIKLATDEGKFIRRGDLVAKIDVEAVNKQIAEVEKSLELAIEVFERQARLWDQKIGSEIQYLQAKNNKERLEKSRETLQFQLTKANIYAPISGVVDMVFAKEGEMASPGAPIIQILNTSRLKVVADAPEDLLGAIKVGDEVEVVFPSLGDTITTRISLLGRRIDPANRTFEIEMNLPNRSGLFKPNLLAEIRVNDFTEEDQFVIPIELVQQEVGGRDFVMIKKADGGKLKAEKLYVETGDSYAGEIVVRSGINETHELILAGARSLSHNELIDVSNQEITE